MNVLSLNITSPSLSQKKIRKLVYMGQLQKQESFGEVSVLLQAPFTCTVVAAEDVKMAIIKDKDILGKYRHAFVRVPMPFYLLCF